MAYLNNIVCCRMQAYSYHRANNSCLFKAVCKHARYAVLRLAVRRLLLRKRCASSNIPLHPFALCAAGRCCAVSVNTQKNHYSHEFSYRCLPTQSISSLKSSPHSRLQTQTMENHRKFGLHSINGDREQDEKLLMPYNYILQVPGKNIRAKLSQAFNYWLNVPEDKLVQIDDIIQTLHNASLLLDDVEDNSVLRRGVPVAHSIYGIPSTINAANYATMIGLEKCVALNHPDAVRVFSEQLLELHRGQGMEIYWRDNYACPTEEEYSDMTKKKTGGLFMLAIRLMQLFSDNKDDFTKLAGILGLYFQIQDDYINLHSEAYMANKSFCEDLTEGKFSFPLIHAINTAEGESLVMHILRQRTRDNEVKKYCVSLLESYGSFEYTRKKLAELDVEAKAEIAHLGSNRYLEEFLNTVLKSHTPEP